ncbi:serine hydrolase domain-containing protein [Candidatus Omnitrophota bacterium]
MKLRFLLLYFLLFTVHSSLSAQDVTLSSGKPVNAGMDETILNAGVSLFEKAVEADSLRSVVLLVARKGNVVLHKAIGWKDKEKRILIKKDAMFRMASNTKPVVATGIGILAEDKKLGFEDNVRNHIQSFDNYRSGFITLHHLLTHTSGFRIGPIFYTPLIEKSTEHPEAPSLQLEVGRFGETGADKPAGTTYSYSNAGFNTLGALIEIVSKKPLEVFLRERIYEPLGMVDSYHHEVADKLDGKLDRMSVVYYKEEGKWTVGWKPGDPPQYPFVRASGGMISTAMDYAVFCQMFLNGGIYNGKRILSEKTVELMITPHTASLYTSEELTRMNNFYGYGWSVSRDGIFSHGGSDGTAAWVDPRHELIVLVFTQSPGNRNLSRHFFQLVQASIFE